MSGTKASPAAVVDVFSRDADAGGYLYARQDRLSATLSNKRTSVAIAEAVSMQGLRVIDLGCGDGTYTTEHVTKNGAAYVLGVDPAPGAVAHARKLASEAGVQNCEFAALSFDAVDDAVTYDIAILRGVLHHLDDPAAAVSKALALARRVVILEPNGLNPVMKMIERFSAYHREHGERSFAPSLIKSWVTKAGGRTTKCQFINLVPMFCPTPLARALNLAEPIVEKLPIIRAIGCGQTLIVAER
jgi:SAM-dependent methyltransferase